MSLNNRIIKGKFFALIFQRESILFITCLFGIIMFLYYSFSNENAINEKPNQPLLGFGLLCLTVFFYWSASGGAYFYEVNSDRLIVKNLLTSKVREYNYKSIEQITFSGYLTMSKLFSNGNSIGISYKEENVSKFSNYYSTNLGEDDWKELIIALNDLGVKLNFDKRFLDFSDFRLPIKR
jgi:hypothetical protein